MVELSFEEYLDDNVQYPFSAVYSLFKENPIYLLTPMVEIIVEGNILRYSNMDYFFERRDQLYDLKQSMQKELSEEQMADGRRQLYEFQKDLYLHYMGEEGSDKPEYLNLLMSLLTIFSSDSQYFFREAYKALQPY
jgi:hypothetical protein